MNKTLYTITYSNGICTTTRQWSFNHAIIHGLFFAKENHYPPKIAEIKDQYGTIMNTKEQIAKCLDLL